MFIFSVKKKTKFKNNKIRIKYKIKTKKKTNNIKTNKK